MNKYYLKMRNLCKSYCLMLAALSMSLASCESDMNEGASSGAVSFLVDALPNFNQTRAVDLNEYSTTANYNVQILSGSKVVFEGTVGSVTNQSVDLESGSYALRAYYGTEAAASQNSFLMEGRKDFVVTAGEETEVEVICLPQCARVAVSFGSQMASQFSDYYVTYTTQALTSAGQYAVWTKENADPWYLKVQANEEVVARIHVVRASDGKWTEVERKYKLSNGKSWTLNIDAQAPESNDGQVALTIVVDESTNDQEVSVVVPNDWWM